jgi:hypothetical protein
MRRRLQNTHDEEVEGVLQKDYAVLLLRERLGRLRIDAAAYGAWLQTYFTIPDVGLLFDEWWEPFLRSTRQDAKAL